MKLGTLYAECRQTLRNALSSHSFATPDLDARLLLCHALDFSSHAPVTNPDLIIDDQGCALVHDVIERRALGEPVARIQGYREFWGLRFDLNDDTLIPRPETEGIVEIVLEWARGQGREGEALTIVDIGTGSGAILTSLLTELPNAIGIGSDISQEALNMAVQNAERQGVQKRFKPMISNYGSALEGTYDVIVSNPPYIRDDDLQNLGDGVKEHDPARALFGGEDGLDAYRALTPWCYQAIREDGICLFEHGFDQQAQVMALAKEIGFEDVQPIFDLSDVPRIVKMVKKSQK
ncbi:MAG: peptide chain release factor N(5)-glutamine methyltransferase [Hyphomicrobiales bacterium]